MVLLRVAGGGMDYINPLNQFISSQTGNERQINGPRTKDIKMTKYMKGSSK